MKLFRNSIAIVLCLLAVQQIASAQTMYASHKTTASGEARNLSAFPTAIFSDLFPQAEEVKWSGRAGDSFVSFLSKGRKATAAFNPKGELTYVITACNMAQLPGEMNWKINTDYADYKLFYAKEVKAHGNIAYHAVLESTKDFVTIKYTDEGLEEIKQVRK